MTQEKPFIDIRNLTVTFTGGRKPVRAVSGVSLSVKRGEVVALIGESGSGKSVTLRSILRLHNEQKSKLEGQIIVGDQDVVSLSNADLSAFRGKVASMIFQEPLLALDPVYTVGEQIIEAILRHENIGKEAARARALSLFERVRIPSPERRLDAYPHEMSGGMRQRAMISLALASHPQLLLADEPTTALDATVQIQILLLLRELQRELGLSVIFVTHDLDDALWLTDSLVVLQKGKITQKGNSKALCEQPKSKYVARLFSSINALPDREQAFIRPADIRIRTRGGIVGHVVDQRFLVHYNTVQVKLREGGKIWEVDDPGRKYQIGDRVYLHVQEEKILVLKS